MNGRIWPFPGVRKRPTYGRSGQIAGVAVNNMSVCFLRNGRSGKSGDLPLYTRTYGEFETNDPR